MAELGSAAFGATYDQNKELIQAEAPKTKPSAQLLCIRRTCDLGLRVENETLNLLLLLVNDRSL